MTSPLSLDLLAIGERIRTLRGPRTQAEFAEQLGSSRMSVVRYEAGSRTPDAEFLCNLCELTGADAVWLLTGKGERPKLAAIALTAEEQVLLDYFRAAAPAVRRAALGALIGAAPGGQSGGVHVVGNGNVAGGRDVNLGHQPDPKRRSR